MYTFIVNPNARSGLGIRVWKQVEHLLKEQDISYRVLYTRYQRHATKLVRELTADHEEHTIVMLGGDGTVDEIVDGITDLSKVTLGYIPIGSSNDFARYFGLSSDAEEALSAVLHPRKYAHMNVGILSYGNNEKSKRFTVSAGMGFDAGVCHQVAVSRLKKILNKLHLGRLVYVGIALSQMLALKPGKMTLWTDEGEKVNFEKVYFAAAMNHPYEGGGFLFCPEADPCDDVLDLTVIAGLPKLKALCLLPLAFKGKHVGFEGVHIRTCKKVIFESEQPMPVHTDGEPIPCQKRMKAELEQEKVRIIVC